MTIPTGPFPAPIAYSDLRVGMNVAATGVWPGQDGNPTTVTNAGIVTSTDATQTTLTHGLKIDPAAPSLSIQLLEAFDGNPAEPAIGTAILAADGTVYQRVGTDPTSTTWAPIGSTATVPWSDITAAGEPLTLAAGS